MLVEIKFRMIKLRLLALCCLISLQGMSQENHLPDILSKRSVPFDSISIEMGNSFKRLKYYQDSIEQHYTSLTSSLQNKTDSLINMNKLTNKFIRGIDSLNQIKDEQLSVIEDKIEQIKANFLNKTGHLNIPPDFQEKIEKYEDVFSWVNTTLPSTQFQVQDLHLPDHFNSSMTAINNLPGGSLPNLPETGLGATEAISENVSQVGELSDAVPKNLNTENLGQAAEASFVKINEIDAVKDQMGNLPTNPLTSEEEIRKELINQAKDAAVDHFAGKEQELKPVMDQISKYKKRFSNVNNLKELERYIKKRPNEMKGKPVIERIVPGIVFQIQKKNDELYVDFNPYVGYRFTGKLTAGLGWNQRVPYNLNSYTFQSDGRIYGPRTFAEYKLWKGFSPRLEGETMNTFVPPYIRKSPGDVGGREWIWGVFAGMKKDYKFFRKINGTAVVMFRLFDPHRKSPYADVVNTRFGFELPMKKRTKSTPQ